MNELLLYLKKSPLIADGACGTYISSLAGRSSSPCELLNLNSPETVLRMHKQYIDSGAKLILTNTFAASEAGDSIGKSFKLTKKIIAEGVRIAKSAAGNKAYVAADIGPLPETNLDDDILTIEYKRIADAFIDVGIKNFVFETFADSKYPVLIAKHIRRRIDDAFILISFAVMPDGISREGITGQALVDAVAKSGAADAVGFNCCSGPSHLLSYAAKVNFGGLLPSIMPNAGYPKREKDDISYSGTCEYFGEKLSEAENCGFKIIGGCCGTTPLHIAKLAEKVKNISTKTSVALAAKEKSTESEKLFNGFENALKSSRKTVIVELEPPLDADISKILRSAKILKEAGVDALTFADSPMARARADSVSIAAFIKREIGIEVIPHVCCRDKNMNAIKSSLIAAHIDKIRNILAITGDPVSDSDRGLVKSVFNFSSEGLIRFISSLNGSIFEGDPLFCGCAFNANASNIGFEINRLKKKLEAGAQFVLTQPIMTDEAAAAVNAAHNTGAKIFPGIITPVTYKNAMFLANEMPGFKMPEKYIKMFSPDMSREDGEKTGIEISVECVKSVADICDGIYFVVPFNRAYVTAEIIKRIREENII